MAVVITPVVDIWVVVGCRVVVWMAVVITPVVDIWVVVCCVVVGCSVVV